MRRLLFIFMISIGCAGVLAPLHAAGLDDYDWFRFNGMNLHARFFVDPDYDASRLEQTAISQADKQAIEEDKNQKSRTLFNVNMMFGIALPYFQIKQMTTMTLYRNMIWPSSSKPKFLGLEPVVNVNFMFNVAKHFALGLGSDLGFMYLVRLRRSSYGSGSGFSYSYTISGTTAISLSSIPLEFSTGVSRPRYYLEIPVFGLTRIYFSRRYRTAYLSLGAGVDFFLLGRPKARGIIARGGLGFIVENGFMMEFAYQYNLDLAQDSQMQDIKDIHKAMMIMGYNFNIGNLGDSRQRNSKAAGNDAKGKKQG